MNSHPIRVLCVDDNDDLIDLLCRLVDAEPDMKVVGTLDRADDLVAEVERCKPDVVLLDLTMPGKDPMQSLGDVAAKEAARVIVFSAHDSTELIDEAVEQGAWGFITKMQATDATLHAIRSVHKGQIALPSGIEHYDRDPGISSVDV